MPESEKSKKISNYDLHNAQFGGGFINAENVNAKRIGGDIWNIFFGQQTTPIGNPSRPKNERILLAAVKEEVTARLRQSLHNAVLINLGKESQPQQVNRPWDAQIKIGLKPPESLPETTTILEVFDSQEIAGKLLILGAPGSGKTTTQLELAQALVSRAEVEPEYPIPVLFNLFSWKDDRQSITDWLVAELKSKYGVSTKLGKKLVINHQLLPILDGLDELEPQHQELCVHAINQFFSNENKPRYLVVCSRSEEYGKYSIKLQLNGAIYLQPFTNNQIYDYLSDINCLELWSTISNNLDLLELVKIPLLLVMTVLVSPEISVEEWQVLTSREDRIQYLLDAYLGQMLTQDVNSRAYLKTKPPNAKTTRMYLMWLAGQMQRQAKSEFLIEEMQPSWLIRRTQKISYSLILGLIFGLIVGLIVGLKMDLIIGLMFGTIYGILCTFNKNLNKISVIEKISLLKINKQTLTAVLICTLIAVLITRQLYGLIFGLIFGTSDIAIENQKITNQGIWKSAFIAIFSGLIFGLLEGVMAGLVHGLTAGLLSGLICGGVTCIQHFTLRLILYRNGYIPWNYARFLDYCTERLFLQRVGGRYRFIHKLLQDHFVQMEFRRD